MSRNTTPEGAMPYIYNPRNGRVMVTTEAKLARVDDAGEPYFVQCPTAAGPEEAKVTTAKTEPAPMEEPPKGEAPETASVSDDESLLTLIMSTEDKDELVAFGKQLDIKLSKSMKPSTMQERLSAKIAELDALR